MRNGAHGFHGAQREPTGEEPTGLLVVGQGVGDPFAHHVKRHRLLVGSCAQSLEVAPHPVDGGPFVGIVSQHEPIEGLLQQRRPRCEWTLLTQLVCPCYQGLHPLHETAKQLSIAHEITGHRQHARHQGVYAPGGVAGQQPIEARAPAVFAERRYAMQQERLRASYPQRMAASSTHCVIWSICEGATPAARRTSGCASRPSTSLAPSRDGTNCNSADNATAGALSRASVRSAMR